MDEAAQWDRASSTDESETTASSNDAFWQPLIFGERQRARVIIADDNADMRRYISSLLRKYCDVVECADGAEAWVEMQTNGTDLIVSDVMMPRMTGFDLLEAIRGHPSLVTTPFIMLSARAGDEARLEGLAKGADGTQICLLLCIALTTGMRQSTFLNRSVQRSFFYAFMPSFNRHR
jgi:CheY-like chemotaxis protein